MSVEQQLKNQKERAKALADERDNLRKSVAAKNAEIEELRGMVPPQLNDLFGQFKDLRRLLALLIKVAEYQDPKRSPLLDPNPVSTSEAQSFISFDAASTREGRATLIDRKRANRVSDMIEEMAKKTQEQISKDITRLARRIENDIRPRGQERSEPQGPRCHKRGCSEYGRRQSYDAINCTGEIEGEPCQTTFRIP